eukprot:766709-Rhodomonas_salina.3
MRFTQGTERSPRLGRSARSARGRHERTRTRGESLSQNQDGDSEACEDALAAESGEQRLGDEERGDEALREHPAAAQHVRPLPCPHQPHELRALLPHIAARRRSARACPRLLRCA